MSALDALPLFPTDEQIARAVLGGRWREWKTIRPALDRHGYPKAHALFGGHYLPAVKGAIEAYLRQDPKLASILPPQEDGESDYSGEAARSYQRRGRSDDARRTRI